MSAFGFGQLVTDNNNLTWGFLDFVPILAHSKEIRMIHNYVTILLVFYEINKNKKSIQIRESGPRLIQFFCLNIPTKLEIITPLKFCSWSRIKDLNTPPPQNKFVLKTNYKEEIENSKVQEPLKLYHPWTVYLLPNYF